MSTWVSTTVVFGPRFDCRAVPSHCLAINKRTPFRRAIFQNAIRCGYRVRTLSLIGTLMQPQLPRGLQAESDPHTKTLSRRGRRFIPAFRQGPARGMCCRNLNMHCVAEFWKPGCD